MRPQLIVPFIWIAWLASWWIGARGTKRTIQRQPTGSRMAYMFPTWLGAIGFVIGQRPGRSWLTLSAAFPPWVAWLGVALLIAGLAYTWWARVHLGRNWSAIVTLKEGHTLVRSGPYAITRHPIYTGIDTAFIGTALTHCTVGVVGGVALFAIAFVIKYRQEERLMLQTFGDEYRDFMRQVPAVIPFAKGMSR